MEIKEIKVQTFLPSISFVESVQCLDNKRLGKQRVEAMQILQALEPDSKSHWRNHPTVKMWKDHEESLKIYHDLCIAEWIRRGFNNTMKYKNPDYLKGIEQFPKWITEEFCAAHRSNLLRKDYKYYSKFGWSEPNDLPYIWPVR